MHVDLTRHPDYAHLDTLPAPGTGFTVDAPLLRRLRGLNGFAIPPGHRRRRPVVVALRGASLPDRSRLWTDGEAIRLVVDHIDHETPRCVILVWRDAHLTAFQGSTVAHTRYLAEQWTLGGQQACLLPTGRYLYRSGTHGANLGGRAIPGALLLPGAHLVYRSNTAGMAHALGDLEPDWHTARTNLHAARTPPDDLLGAFSSAGCLTIPGAVGVAPWTEFQARVGTRASVRREVILLTGAEAWRAMDPAFIEPRIRPGTHKPRIRALEKRLGLRVTGRFGPRLYERCRTRFGVAVPSL